MYKNKKLNNKKHVGADASVCPSSKGQQNKGITLIGLIITIIVMLILVSVTISLAINGGLFEKAGEAVGDTKNAINAEQQLADGRIKIGDKWYASIDDYLVGKELLFSYNETAKDDDGYLTANATYESDGYTATVPKGFKVSEVEGEQAIGTGLVIKDANGNEFVWIPVTEDLGASYSSYPNYSEPKELTGTWADSTNATKPKYDSQEILDELYGKDYYNYAEDFKYVDEYVQMVEKVNEYDGFYIGRYETTIDEAGNIGSKYNTTVLTMGTTLFIKDGTNYPYRWYGLYSASKRMNVPENGTNVQTAMIYGVLYDKTMDFIRTQKVAGKTTYDVDTETGAWHGAANGHMGVVKSGQANPGANGDVALNIWDLESNVIELTQEAFSSYGRATRGDNYGGGLPAFNRGFCGTINTNADISPRSALYIK